MNTKKSYAYDTKEPNYNQNDTYYQNQDYFHRRNDLPDDQIQDNSSQIISAATIGGTIAITAAAALRWLNGGDFVLFPPPCTSSNTSNDNHINNSTNTQMEINMPHTTNTPPSNQDASNIHDSNQKAEEDSDKASSEYDADISNPFQNDESNFVYNINHDNVNHQHNIDTLALPPPSQIPTKSTPTNTDTTNTDTRHLANTIQQLTESIQDLRLYQEKKHSKNKSNQLTNSAMTLLQASQLDSMPNTDHHSTTNTYNPSDQVNNSSNLSSTNLTHLALQLTQIKTNLSNVKEFILTNHNGEETSKQPIIILDQVDDTIQHMHDQIINNHTETIIPNINHDKNNIMEHNITTKDQNKNQLKDKTNTTSIKSITLSDHKVNLSSQQQPSTHDTIHASHEYIEFVLKTNIQDSKTNNNNNHHQLISSTLVKALHTIQIENDKPTLLTGIPMLHLYARNLSKFPNMSRYQKINTSSSTFQNKLGTLKGSIDLLQAIGFVEDGNVLEWKPESIQQQNQDNENDCKNAFDENNTTKNNHDQDNTKTPMSVNTHNSNERDYALIIVKEAADAIQKILTNLNKPNSSRNSLLQTPSPIRHPSSPSHISSSHENQSSFQTPNTKDALIISPPATKKTDSIMNPMTDIHSPLRET